MRKKVIVLGGSSGIGKAIAERFAKEGWQVIVGSSHLAAVQKVVSTLEGEGHVAAQADVSSEEQIKNLTKLVKEKFSNFHVLINSVGISKNVPVLDSDFSEWNCSLEVMLYGSVRTCRSIIPLMDDGGRIIHVTSIHHERVAKGSSAYGMAKAAITQLTRSLAVELAP